MTRRISLWEHGLRGPPEQFTIVGITGFGKADNLAGATLSAFETTTAQRVLGKAGRYDSVDAVAAEGIDTEELRASVEQRLPEGFEAVTGRTVADESAATVKSELGFFNVFLLVFAGISLFVGAFLILNTFSILV